MHIAWLCTTALVATILPGAALAAEDFDATVEPAPAPTDPSYGSTTADEPRSVADRKTDRDRRSETLDRPLLYLVDPRLPAPLEPLVSYSPSYTSIGAAVRPLAANVGRSGLVNELHFELGILDRFAPFATAYLAPPLENESRVRGAFEAGARFLVTDPDSEHFRVALDGAYLRDFAETSVAYGAVTATYDVDRLRFAGLVHAEHAFAPGRDAIDLYVDAGTSVRVVDRLRIGAEYVVQEIEDAWSHDAEGGARDFASLSLAWANDRVSLAAGPAFGLGGGAPALLGRAVASVTF